MSATGTINVSVESELSKERCQEIIFSVGTSNETLEQKKNERRILKISKWSLKYGYRITCNQYSAHELFHLR